MKLAISFTKYHGCGNDFIIIDELDNEIVPEELKGTISKILCERKFSIGADDVLYVQPSEQADAKMRIFEPDGSEADMCGNGIRCVADYLYHKFGKEKFVIETKAGLKTIERINGLYKVNMGKLGTKFSEFKKFVNLTLNDNEKFLERVMNFPELGEVKLSIVNTGEPHIVIFVENVDKENIEKYGESIAKRRDLFPHGINLNLVEMVDENKIKVRTYERGVWKETLACGTGCTASAAVSHLLGKIKEKRVKVLTKGGELLIEIGENLLMTGPAQKVFTGALEINV